jgi:hypothetical protein
MRALAESTPLFAGETQIVAQHPQATRQSGSPEHCDWQSGVHVDVETLASRTVVTREVQRPSETWLQMPISVCALSSVVTAAHVCGTPIGQSESLHTHSTSRTSVPSTRNPQLGNALGSTVTPGHVEMPWHRVTVPVESVAQFEPVSVVEPAVPDEELSVPASAPVLS